MKKPTLALATLALAATLASAGAIVTEHVTGGALDLTWHPGFGVSNNMAPMTLDPSHPAYTNPSGDHTVARATTSIPDSGGIILTCTDPQGLDDYTWEAWIFTGDGNSRRGLVVRADPTSRFQSSYQFVIQSGLLQMNFRKLIGQMPTTLRTWFTSNLPGGIPAVNTWHHMMVVADGSSFRCFWDHQEMPADNNGMTMPVVDTSLPTGWVGVYNFRADQGGISFLTDDLILTEDVATTTRQTSWGGVKARYGR